MNNIIEDLSTLTTIPSTNLSKLAAKVEWCICDAVAQSQLEGNDITSIDLSIGTLYISVEPDAVKYKFVPSRHLEQSLITTAKTKKSPLEKELEDTLASRIVNTYKDFI